MKTPPAPEVIKSKRLAFGMSCREFDAALGYSTDGRITQALEAGKRDGRKFEMMGTAAAALTYLTAMRVAYEMLVAGDRPAAMATLAEALPMRLRA